MIVFCNKGEIGCFQLVIKSYLWAVYMATLRSCYDSQSYLGLLETHPGEEASTLSNQFGSLSN